MKSIIFIAPHPDDETLGGGGAIQKHVKAGDNVSWLILTNISVEAGFDEEVVVRRQKEIEKIASAYGFKQVIKYDWPTTKLGNLDFGEMVGKLTETFKELKPEVLYIPNGNDVHSDHRVAFEAIISSSKTFNHPYIKKVLMYEVPSETDFAPALAGNAFVPNVFCDITPYMDMKIEIMSMYAGEMKTSPFPRCEENLRAVATVRGASSGVKYAEAFMLLKEIL